MVGSDHLPIEISIDGQPHRNIYTNPIRYKFNQTDREVFESTLKVALSSGDVLKLKSTQNIDKYADFIVTAISTVVDNKKRSHTQLDSRKQVIAFQDRVITTNIKEAQHPLKREKQVIGKSSIMLKISTKSMHRVPV